MLPARISSKPQYVLHPLRALRRAGRMMTFVRGATPSTEPRIARLPWDVELRVHESDAIGYSILVGRVFDPCVTEVIHRLVDPGDVVVDVGANVGYLTSLAAARAGRLGRVIAVEPHPAVFGLLQSNVESWSGDPRLAPIELHRLALSDRAGVGTIVGGPHFEWNMGLSKLAEREADGQQSHEVQLRRVDELLARSPVGLLKVDVEGHEAAVLAGAGGLLEQHLVRDIIFEDHIEYPSEAAAIVERAGYHLVSLSNDLRGLHLTPPAERGPAPAWPGPSYLATIDPERSVERLKARGWQVGGIGIGRSR
jgi:FkbM family methyltransferase